ncbi:DUF998 domain-containing protein [Halobacteria archaeon AArc-dxtr1]|nr:DUF998 domain-containing protein [Halobacteria archaeon AArc-dxtr1]
MSETYRGRNQQAVRAAAACGLLAPLVAIGTIVLSSLLAPTETFTWSDRALSDMGRLGAETFWLFNGGLVLGGLLGIPFAWRLWIESQATLERAGIALVAVATISLVGVGVFFLDHTDVYLGTDLHGPAALLYFALGPVAQWMYGSGLVLTERVRLGLTSIWLGISQPVIWLAWLLSRRVGEDPMGWFAVPELLAAAAFGAWIFLLAAAMWRQ